MPLPEDDPLFPSEEPPEPQERGFVTEFVRKMAVVGLGALFMTEEGLRNLAGQLKLPKELLSLVLQQAEKTKSEVGRVVSEEIRSFLQSDKLRDEFVKLFSQMTIEVKADIRLKPPDGSSAPAVQLTELKAKKSPPARRGKKD